MLFPQYWRNTNNQKQLLLERIKKLKKKTTVADWIKTISGSARIDATFYQICFYFQSKDTMAILGRYFEFVSQQTALFQKSIGLGRCELNIRFYV